MATAETEVGLEELAARLQQKRAELGANTSTSSDGYPGLYEREYQCTEPDCGRSFVVPQWFNAPGQPIGGTPKLCPTCVADADAKAAERIRLEEDAERTAKANQQAADVLRKVEQAGGNPFEYGDLTLETFVPKPGRAKALDATREWVAAVLQARDKYAKVRGLYLVGDTGTAKTALAHCAVRSFIEAGIEPVKGILFDDSLSLIERIKGTYGSDENTWKFLEARIHARVWILDDFMAEKQTDDVIQKLTLIFNRREGKPTMVTSNYAPDTLRDRHKEAFRMLSRFGIRQFRTVAAHGDDGRFDREDVRRVAAQ